MRQKQQELASKNHERGQRKGRVQQIKENLSKNAKDLQQKDAAIGQMKRKAQEQTNAKQVSDDMRVTSIHYMFPLCFTDS